jgi:hypothetical protein
MPLDIFKPRTFVWWQVSIIKVCLLSLGIAVGAYWHVALLPFAGWLLALGLITGVYLAVIALKKKGSAVVRRRLP